MRAASEILVRLRGNLAHLQLSPREVCDISLIAFELAQMLIIQIDKLLILTRISVNRLLHLSNLLRFEPAACQGLMVLEKTNLMTV